MTKKLKAIYKLAEYWKSQLRMRDYDVAIILEKEKQGEEMQEYSGYAQSLSVHKIAKIVLVEKDDNGYLKQDLEVTLVHELLHVKFNLIEETMDDTLFNFYHPLLEDMARALVFSKKNKPVKTFLNFEGSEFNG